MGLGMEGMANEMEGNEGRNEWLQGIYWKWNYQ